MSRILALDPRAFLLLKLPAQMKYNRNKTETKRLKQLWNVWKCFRIVSGSPPSSRFWKICRC